MNLNKATDKLISELKPQELGKYVAELEDKFGRDVTDGRMTWEAAEWELNILFEKHLKHMPANDYIQFLLSQQAATTKILLAVIGEKDLKIMDLKMSLMELMIDRIACTDRMLSVMNFTCLDPDEADAKRAECITEARESMKPFVERLTALRKEYEEYAKDDVWTKIGRIPEPVKRDSLLAPEIVEKYNLPPEAVQ